MPSPESSPSPGGSPATGRPHIPRSEHAGLIRRIAGWLRLGGLFVAALGGGSGQEAGIDDRWLGLAPMYGSFWPPTTSLSLINDPGLDVIDDEDELLFEDGHEVPSWWVIARRPSHP